MRSDDLILLKKKEKKETISGQNVEDWLALINQQAAQDNETLLQQGQMGTLSALE